MRDMEGVNRKTWRKPSSLKYYGSLTGYETAGERVLMAEAERRHAGGRILDLGCGGGRTANLIKHFAGDYLGIDYTPQLVRIARENHPDLTFKHQDARDLSDLGAASYDLALFSFNGIDSVGPDGRMAVLREVFRVLAPGGSFAFSSFNRHWCGFDRSTRRRSAYSVWSYNPVRVVARLIRAARTENRKRRYWKDDERGEHALLLHSAHDYGIIVYATSPAQIRSQLREAGFGEDIDILTKDGLPIEPGLEVETEYFHILARKGH